MPNSARALSCFDELQPILQSLWRVRLLCTLPPAIAVVFAAAYLVVRSSSWITGAAVAVVAGFAGVWLVDKALQIALPGYRKLTGEIAELELRVGGMRSEIQNLYANYPRRSRGKQFKIAYALNNRNLADFEAAMAIGMKYEEKEVFVTAFVRGQKVVRVTASIGSHSRCSAADDPRRWPEHYRRLGCDELRQYHNHPHYKNHTTPSPQDRRAKTQLDKIVEPAGISLQSFVVYWNEIYEWRLLKYNADQLTELEYAFDVTA